MTPGGFACGRPPMDGDLSPAALAARATREMYAALFARDTLKPRGCSSCPQAPPGSSPKAIRFPGDPAEVETDPRPRVNEGERKTPLIAPYVREREINIYWAESFILQRTPAFSGCRNSAGPGGGK